MKNTGVKILVLLCSITILYGCAGATNDDSKSGKKTIIQEESSEGTFPGLSAETERQIKLDYLKNYFDKREQSTLTLENIPIDYYFGKYNNFEVIGFSANAAVLGKYTVAGYVFNFPYPLAHMLAWKLDEKTSDGIFYEVREAYDLELLTEDDIKDMNERHRNEFPRDYEFEGARHE